jgi:hypothetical protein
MELRRERSKVACERPQGGVAAGIAVDVQAPIDEQDPLHAELGPAAAQVQVSHGEVHVDGTGSGLQRAKAGIEGRRELVPSGIAEGSGMEGRCGTIKIAGGAREAAVHDVLFELAALLIDPRATPMAGTVHGFELGSAPYQC